MRRVTLALSIITPVFIYSQLASMSLTFESVLFFILISGLCVSLIAGSVMLGDK